MTVSRRDLFRTLGTASATAVVSSLPASAETRTAPADALGLLYDTTVCIGCKACVAACTAANNLDPDTEMSGGIWQMPADLNAQTKNIIQIYRSPDGAQASFMKRQCMQCVDPACASACGRPLDIPILATLAKFMAWSSIVFVVARFADVVIRGRLGLAFAPDWYSVLFHGENLFVLVPSLVLLNDRLRHIPRVLFLGAAATAIGGLVYRFNPTTLAFRYGRSSIYFPSTQELLMCVGYIGLAIALFILVVRRFAILPDRVSEPDRIPD